MKKIFFCPDLVTESYFVLFLICSHIPPTGDKITDVVSKTNGTGVFLLTQNWYLERREMSPTLVCISPNRIPGKQN
jgi:hypothetical protein